MHIHTTPYQNHTQPHTHLERLQRRTPACATAHHGRGHDELRDVSVGWGDIEGDNDGLALAPALLLPGAALPLLRAGLDLLCFGRGGRKDEMRSDAIMPSSGRP